VNGLYGNEDFSSQVRVKIQTRLKSSLALCD